MPLYQSVVSGLLRVQSFCGSSIELEKLERRGMSGETPSLEAGQALCLREKGGEREYERSAVCS